VAIKFASNFSKKFASKEIFLFDLDGTLYLGRKVLPGAKSLVNKLHRLNKKVFYFTNNSSRSDAQYVRKLRKMGFPCEASQIVMSTHTLIRGLKSKGLKRVYCLGTPAMKSMLKRSRIIHTSVKPQAVVVGFDKTLTYSKLLFASRLIDKGVPYFVAHPDFFCPTDRGPEPDCGSIALLLEKTCRKKPIAVYGKPHPWMIDEVIRRQKCSRSKMILIGDRLQTDILMAKASRIQSLLVLSGETKRKDLKASKLRPDFVLRSVAEILL